MSKQRQRFLRLCGDWFLGASREICKICYRVNAVGFSVPDAVWQAVVPAEFQTRIICLACFTQLADEKLIAWDGRIEFFPVSMAICIDLAHE